MPLAFIVANVQKALVQQNSSPFRFKIGLRLALFIAMMASVTLCGLLVHATWWNTTRAISQNLLEALETQIADSARRAWWGRISEVEGRVRALRVALAGAATEATQRDILVSAALSTGNLSWLIFVPAAGPALAVEDHAKIGPDSEGIAVSRVERDGTTTRFLPDAPAIGSAIGKAPRALAIFGMEWLEGPVPQERWFRLRQDPGGSLGAVAFVARGPEGTIAAMIDDARLASLLGEIPVGLSGRAFVLGADGAPVIVSAPPGAAATLPPGLAEAAQAAGGRVAARPEAARDTNEKVRLAIRNEGFAIGLSPLWFNGWQLAIILPEADFLKEIDQVIAKVALGLAFFVLVAGGIGALATRRLVAKPISAVADDLALIERFALESVPRRFSRLVEIDRLSEAISRMSAGLADFGKFIPTDLVRNLLKQGMRAEPGGSRREITVLFADLAGFTALSEKLGDDVVPIVSRFLDLASRLVVEHGGTVDKYIGDAVMAFWGAPGEDPLHAKHACEAALAIEAELAALRLSDPRFAALHVRIGLQSGPAIVGNIGSASRLNYTALGDTVNLASRLESVNKIYGTKILIGPGTAEQAGDALIRRELDEVTVYGKADGVAVFELLGLAGDRVMPAWASDYEAALATYRQRDFSGALLRLNALLAERPKDGPGNRLRALAEQNLRAPPPVDWRAKTSLDMK